MKNREKAVLLGIFFGTLILAAGCSKGDKNVAEAKWEVPRMIGDVAVYEDGFYYLKDMYWLSYYDTKSKEAIVLCEKNGCRHNSEKCFAYTQNEVPQIWDGKLYEISVSNELIEADMKNSKKKKVVDFTKELQSKENSSSINIIDYLISGNQLYLHVRETVYGNQKEYEKLYVYNMKTKEKKKLAEADYAKEYLEIIQAKGNVLYYTKNTKAQQEDTFSMSEQEMEQFSKEMERTTHAELYRMDTENEKAELVKELSQGRFVTANDDIGVYYYEFEGNGSHAGKKLYHMDGENKGETVVMEKDGENLISVTRQSAPDYTVIGLGKEMSVYDLNTFKKTEFSNAVLQETGLVWKVPNGYAVEAETEENQYDWYYIPEEEAKKEDGKLLLAE